MATRTETKKRKSPSKPKLHVGLLIDESGSMAPLHGSVIAGVNEFISELKADEPDRNKDVRVRASLAFFDLRGEANPVRVRFSGLKLSQVRPLGPSDYAPHGSTPLNDAVIQTIGAIDGRVSKGDRAMLVILTDGYENASEASTEDVRKLIAAKEGDGWEFIYLGANHDTWAESQKIGLAQAGKQFRWQASDGGLGAAMKVSSKRVKRFRDAPGAYREELDSLSSEIQPGDEDVRRRRD